jgi:hypothetical protein
MTLNGRCVKPHKKTNQIMPALKARDLCINVVKRVYRDRIASRRTCNCCCLCVALTAEPILHIGKYYYYYCRTFILVELWETGNIKCICIFVKQKISIQLSAELWKSSIHAGRRLTYVHYVPRHSNLRACLRNSTQSFQNNLLKTFQHKFLPQPSLFVINIQVTAPCPIQYCLRWRVSGVLH